ncbi:MAG TPA: DUF6089 family protein [Chitinophagaceae bacterium]|nr:DUF6089 family protein [Chitinophagaceae bacterium]
MSECVGTLKFKTLIGLVLYFRRLLKLNALKRFILFTLMILPLGLWAQQNRSYKDNHHEVGLKFGAANYYGDLQTEVIPWGRESSKTYRPSVGIIYKHFFNPHVGVRFEANYMRITAADSLSNNRANQLRNLNFTNDMVDLSGALELNFLPVDVHKFKVSPYVFVGVGAVYSNPYTLDINSDKTHLRTLGTEGQGLSNYPDRQIYSTIHPMIPLGGGVKFFIGETFVLSAEVAIRYAGTDYLDDVSRSYVNMDTLLAYRGAKSVELSYRGNQLNEWDGNYPNYEFQRGDHKMNDWYWTAGITATIYFDAFSNFGNYIQTNCPRIFGRRR